MFLVLLVAIRQALILTTWSEYNKSVTCWSRNILDCFLFSKVFSLSVESFHHLGMLIFRDIICNIFYPDKLRGQYSKIIIREETPESNFCCTLHTFTSGLCKNNSSIQFGSCHWEVFVKSRQNVRKYLWKSSFF